MNAKILIIMHNYLSNWGLQVIILLGIIYLISYFAGTDISTSLSFLFGLCGSGEGCGNSSEGDGGACAGGGGRNGGPSTPFLCTWNGKKFELENDILFGKPTSFFRSNILGKQAYESGLVTGDMYKIRNNVALDNNGNLKLQLREIEPEESHFDYFAVKEVTHPANTVLFVHSNFENYSIFKQEDIVGQSIVNTKITAPHLSDKALNLLSNPAGIFDSELGVEHEYEINIGDSMMIEAMTDINKTGDLYIFLGARYHDWTAGIIPDLDSRHGFFESILSPFQRLEARTVGNIAKATALSLLVAFIWTLSGIVNVGGVSDQSGEKNQKVVNGVLSTPRVLADTPGGSHSLNISYWNGKEYIIEDVVHPRFYQRDVSVLKIPKQAVDSTGRIRIKIDATETHKISSAIIAQVSEVESNKVREFKVVSAISESKDKDFAATLNNKNSGEYLSLLPGEKVDLIMHTDNKSNDDATDQKTYLVESAGYYVEADEDTYKKSGDWVNKLDSDSRDWLKKMYSLRGYTALK